MEITYSDEVALSTGTYTVQASVGAKLTATILGADEIGNVETDVRVEAPVAALGDVHQVLRRLLDGVRQLDLAQAERTTRGGISQPAATGQPWTDEADRKLQQDWMEACVDDPAREVIAELARVRDRTPGAIRSRLIRLDCDPDTVGARLTVDE